MVPIRCFTCGALIGDKYAEFLKRVKGGEEARKVLDDMKVKRYCCRRMLLSNVEIVDQVLPYYEGLAARHAEFEAEEG